MALNLPILTTDIPNKLKSNRMTLVFWTSFGDCIKEGVLDLDGKKYLIHVSTKSVVIIISST